MKVIIPTNEHADRLRRQGYAHIAGIDEVGRGALAGPVVAAAVILPRDLVIDGVRDSKLLSPARRRRVATQIRRQARAIGLGWVSNIELDAYGLSWAVRQSGLRALADLGHAYDAVLLDGNNNYLSGNCISEAIIRADALAQVVACASIIAKVARDNYMALMHRRYPGWGFDRHKGYGTAVHLAALTEISPLHRVSWLGRSDSNQVGLASANAKPGLERSAKLDASSLSLVAEPKLASLNSYIETRNSPLEAGAYELN